MNENILKEKLKGFFDTQKRKLSTKKKKVMNLNIWTFLNTLIWTLYYNYNIILYSKPTDWFEDSRHCCRDPVVLMFVWMSSLTRPIVPVGVSPDGLVLGTALRTGVGVAVHSEAARHSGSYLIRLQDLTNLTSTKSVNRTWPGSVLTSAECQSLSELPSWISSLALVFSFSDETEL